MERNASKVKMETEEVHILKKRFFESRQQSRSLKQVLRDQRERSRQLMTACAVKLQEKEEEIEMIHARREEELSLINRELTFLQANMVKEQKKLKEALVDKDVMLQKQETELRELRKQNKKLLQSVQLRTKLLANEDGDMDTPSSEDSSPKSSFSSKSNKVVEIKPRAVANKIAETVADETPEDTPSVTPPPPLQPRLPPRNSNSQSEQSKPPIPSRAGVNRKLNKPPAPPAPPLRSSSVKSLNDTDRIDSGRESDGFNTDLDLSLNNVSSESLFATSRSDDGFSSSHEERVPPLPPPRTSSSGNANNNDMSTIRQLTNHRAVQKPSDIKYRSKLRSATIPPSSTSVLSATNTLNLGVLEEHHVTQSPGSGSSDVKRVTYWAGPYV